MSYYNRILDLTLRERLDSFGAVLLEGPKWCGKTTTAFQQANSVIFMQDVNRRTEYLTTAMHSPSFLLEGDTPRLIDEWQDAPQLWDAVRMSVDQRQATGQFILTGSNSVDQSKILHSGIGRISRLMMHPMSLWETKESTGAISLKNLFDHPDLDIGGIRSNMSIKDIVHAACRGGWPATLNLHSEKSKLLVARNYLAGVCRDDISHVDGVQRNEKTTRLILKSYARNISTLAKKSSILADVTSSGMASLSIPTFDSYLDSLNKLFVIQDIEAWCPAIRSKTAIRGQAKRGFVDPSIAVAALGLSYEALLLQLKTFGFIFEQMCARDLRAYTPDFDTHLSYYRDRYGLESDLVLHLADGRYALIECKLGSFEIDDGVRHLLTIRDLIRKHNATEKQVPLREPDLMMVLTGGEFAYRRQDGVFVIPLTTLRD